MKKYIIFFAMTLIVSMLMLGCTNIGGGEGGGIITENGDIIEKPDNDLITEDGTIVNGNGSENSSDNKSENPSNNENDNDQSGNENSTPPVGNSVGNLFKSITIKDINGNDISPDDFRGKIVIVNIWATWCSPCKAELPDFSNIATEYKEDVVIIAAHTPNGNENAKDYVDLNFSESDIIFAYDTNDSQAYLAAGGVGYVPHTAILDENGVIIYSDYGVLSYERLVSIIEGQLSK